MITPSEDNISELSIEQLKREIITLRRENQAGLLTIDKLLKDANQSRDKIKHLESLISQSVPVIKKESQVISVSVTPEEEIAQTQLERLRQASQARSLTLEEIRAYDLLVKNKRLVLDESTINLGKNDYRDISDAKLLEAAITEVKSYNDPDAE
jgi:hypothetical protein